MTIRTLLIATTLATTLAAPVLADQPGKDWISLDAAAAKLSEAGYTGVRKLKADDGQWEAKAVKDGRAVEVRVDPHSGAVSEDRDD